MAAGFEPEGAEADWTRFQRPRRIVEVVNQSPIHETYDKTIHDKYDNTYGKSWSWSRSYDLNLQAEDTPKPVVVAFRALCSFFSIGTVAACKVVAEHAFGRGDVSRHKLSLKNVWTEGAYWGAAAGAFEGLEFGVELMRGRSDWKNAVIGGALAGAVVSVAAGNRRLGGDLNSRAQQVLNHAIAGCAIGTAVGFIRHPRHVHRFGRPITTHATTEAVQYS